MFILCWKSCTPLWGRPIKLDAVAQHAVSTNMAITWMGLDTSLPVI